MGKDMKGGAGHPRRSSGTLQNRRVQLPWPKNRVFRILSIDGGGIRGIFPAAFLAELEERYLGNNSVASYFDLITGTSTGGIIAIGLASGLSAKDLRNIYVNRGCEIFPSSNSGLIGKLQGYIKKMGKCVLYSYDRKALVNVLVQTLGTLQFGQASKRLCIPSFDGRYEEVYIFKTPHHPDFCRDRTEMMTKVATATAAAPTFFKPFRDGGYTFVDGGVWANNPVMVGLVDALTCFDVSRENIRILSLGCGGRHHVVDGLKVSAGGLFFWWDIIYTAMRLQSLNALGQAGLLIGKNRIIRVEPPEKLGGIALDDWKRASRELPESAKAAADDLGVQVKQVFLKNVADLYEPVVT